eukprot:9871418-Lingulodinium_polyedra.AAC.1
MLYDRGDAMYRYLFLVTGVSRVAPRLRHQLPEAWELASAWQLLEPTAHREVVPEALAQALASTAIMLGWHRWAAAVLIMFYAIARPTE